MRRPRRAPVIAALLAGCAHHYAGSGASPERELIPNGSQLAMEVVSQSSEAVTLKLVEVAVCREAEHTVQAFQHENRRVSSRWLQPRQPCPGAAPRPAAGTPVDGFVWFGEGRPAYSIHGRSDAEGRAMFRISDVRAAAAYCGSADLRFEPIVTAVREVRDNPTDPYSGTWLPERVGLSLPQRAKGPIADISDPKAADAARQCCRVEARTAAYEPCRDECAGITRARDCLEVARACTGRERASALWPSCEDAFSICLAARGSSSSKWQRCESNCVAREVDSTCR